MFKPLFCKINFDYIQVGSSPFYVTAFHDGVDGLRLDYLEVIINFVCEIIFWKSTISFISIEILYREHPPLKRVVHSQVLFTSGATIRCDIGDEMDDHEFLKLNCS